MSEIKRQAVLDAAQAQFLRYGFRRVTMGDIAAAAGISRPALYLLFANKEAIFNGVFARYVDASLAEIESGIGGFPSVSEKLAFAVEIWTVRPYELLHDTPEGQELTDCNYGFAADVVRHSYQRFEAIIEATLSPAEFNSPDNTGTPAAHAQVFALALRGIKAGAQDATHLRSLVTHLIAITTSALDRATARTNTESTAAPGTT